MVSGVFSTCITVEHLVTEELRPCALQCFYKVIVGTLDPTKSEWADNAAVQA